MTEHPYERWLDRVGNPSQYMGGEVNAVIKDASAIDCRLALCFPDLYKIGMSNFGLKILYSVVNAGQNLWAERFFAPEPDMEEILREHGEPLRSLESHDPLSAFDIAGFSIATELCHTEILAMLDLGGIPLLRKQRKDSDPIVIGGGPSVYNPEPIADFFDLFVLGEAEEVLPAICRTVGDCRKNGVAREEIIGKLALLDGVYVPSFFEVSYDGHKVKEIKSLHPSLPAPKRVFISDLNASPYPFDMVMPYGRPVFDRLSVEVDRGCTGGCRFCQAGITYRPVRERKPSGVLNIIHTGLKETGYDEVSLASLSSGDYSCIEPLVSRLMDETESERVSLSLPSLRSGTLTEELISQVGRVRKTGFTITAEAGNERLRRVINKNISDDEIIQTAQRVLEGGWRNLKLYFMTGLPTETDEDVESIVRLVSRIRGLTAGGKRFRQINVGVSQFVPKPFTPFQWVAMDSPESLLEKKQKLIRAFKKMGPVSLKGHEVEASFIEGVFARGDRRLGEAVLKAYGKGCRLDNWSGHFRYDLWRESFEECGIDPLEYANRERGEDETLPWDHLDIGVSKKFLLKELNFSRQEIATEDCRGGSCNACGLNPKYKTIAIASELPTARPAQEAEKTEKSWRYRIAFKKTGIARYLSHLELKTAFGRAARRAGLPVVFSLGMHPHPKFSFGPAVSVGIASLCEFIDVELAKEFDEREICDSLNRRLENGMEVTGAALLAPPYKSIQAATAATVYKLSYEKPSTEFPIEAVKAFLDGFEGIDTAYETKAGGVCLRITTANPGILSKLRKGFPGYTLGGGIRLVKTDVIMGESVLTM